MIQEIRWEEPSKLHGQDSPDKAKWGALADALHEKPGEWALVAENVSPGGYRTHLTRRGLEVTTRGVKAGRAEKVYARAIPLPDWPVTAANIDDFENFGKDGK